MQQVAGVAVRFAHTMALFEPAVSAAALFGSLRYLSNDDSVGGPLVEHLLNRGNIVR